jgi:VCBS repeat-containing protein
LLEYQNNNNPDLGAFCATFGYGSVRKSDGWEKLWMLRGFQTESADYAHVVRLSLSEGPAPDHVEIGDTQFLFSAHFKKSGADLVLTGDDGHKLVLVDYFNLAKRPDLTSHGATMSADLVTHLAGPDAPGQYAQAGAPAGAQVIGKCERIGGGATVQHANGITEELKADDVILKGDVVMTNDGSSAVLSLIDGTVFNMGASARMVLSDLIYDANSTSNSAVVSLVKGTFSFVAGHVAHTGDMKLDTPVATMGIRGTAGTTTVNADATGNVYEVNFSLMPDPDGHVGLIQVFDRVTGLVIGTISTTANVLNVQPTANFQIIANESPKAAAQVQAELAAAQVLYPVYQAVAATVAAPPAPPAPTGPQGGQQNNPPPGGSLNQPQQTGPAVNFSANVNADTAAVTATKVAVDPTPSTPTTPTPTPPNPTVTTPTLPAQPEPPPPGITAITPPHLQELGADQPGTLVSVATLTVTGQIDINALVSAGWAVPAGAPSTFFQKDFAHGTASLDINNSTLTYSLNVVDPSVATLQLNHTLQDSVAVPVQGGPSTTVAFTIDGVAHPTGLNTTASVNENVAANPTQVILHPQATDPISSHLTYEAENLQGSAANSTAHGTLVQNPDGTFTYTPNAGFYGTDKIHFIAKDGQFLASDDFTITVTINPVVAAIVGGSSVVTGDLLANDTNPNDAIVSVTLDAAGDNTFTVDGLYGELVVNANGHYTYTLGFTSAERASLVALGDGHSAQDVFTYTISDGTVSSDANLVVDVTNHVPTISVDAVTADNLINAGEANAGFAITGSETGADGQPVTVSIVDHDGNVVASCTTSASEGGWSVNVSGEQATALADGSYTATADVSDQFGNPATEATQTLAVHETLPTISIAAIAGDNVINASEANAGFAITGSETGADGRPVTVSILDGDGHVVASYTTTASGGNWSVGVTSQQATALAEGSYTVTADVSDQFGNQSALATRAFTVNQAPPVILSGQTTAFGAITVPAGAVGSPLTALAASYLTDSHDLVNGLGGSAGFGENALVVGDDNSSSAINITAVFGSQGLNFFGHDYTSIYINNNGNITFAGPSSTFTPSQITAGANNPIIAAFWADVDTRGGAGTSTGGNATGSNRVYYDLDATNGVLTVTWDDVGYYNSHKDKLDAFQLQLVSLGNGNFDIVYRYQNINWTTGDASGGSGGLAGPGGSPARAGFSAGDGVHYFELPQSGNQTQMLAVETATGNTGIAGVDVFQVSNGEIFLTTGGHIDFTDADTNDVHSIGNVTYTGSGQALGTLSFVKDSDTSSASHIGQFTWTYSVPTSSVASFSHDDTRTETFDVTISDGNGGSAVQTITVTLHGPDQAPGAVNDTVAAQPTNPIATGNLLANESFDGDSVIGENGNINNTYHFVGGPNAPQASFEGGPGSGWNTAIFSDPRASYTITHNADNIDITNPGDPAHGGTLTIDGAVQALAFAPTEDPTPGINGEIIHASGDLLLILNNVNNPPTVQGFAIDGAATLEFAHGDINTDVTFNGPGGTLKLDEPATFGALVHGFGANFIDFVGVGSSDTLAVSYNSNNNVTTLVLAHQGQTDAAIALAEDHSDTPFFVTDDGHGNALVGTDHAPEASFVNIAVDASALGSIVTIPGDFLTHFGADPDQGDQISLVSVDESQTLGQVYETQSRDVVYTPPTGFVGQPGSDQFSYELADSHGLISTGHVALTAQTGTQIVGTTGHDLVMGVSGDTLTGMGGDDAFVFQANFGSQTVSDFHQGADQVDLSAFAAAHLGETQSQAAQALQALIDATTAGSHTLALDASHVITFQGVDVHQLNATNDFILTHVHGTTGA